MRRLRIVTTIMVTLAIAIAIIVPLLLPESVGSRENKDFATQASISLALSLFAITAAVIFLLGLKDFKTEFKKTYYLICAGLVVQAMALLVFPTAIYFDTLSSSFTSYAGDLFYAVGAVFIFAGLSHFAWLLRLTTWLKNFFIVGTASAGLSILLWFLPHTLIQVPEFYFDVTKSFVSAECILSLFCVALVLTIRSNANRMYSRPLLWMAGGLVLDASGAILYYLAHHLAQLDGTPHADLVSLSGVALLLTRVVYIVTAYKLASMTQARASVGEAANPIDIIVELASYVSKPSEVELTLDKLRAITVALPANNKAQSLMPQQIQRLEEIYCELQDYLLNKEPLLKFTKESLRRKLEHKFGSIPFERAYSNA